MQLFISHLSQNLFRDGRQGKNVVFLFLIAPLAKGQTWQQQILFLSFARSVPFSLSNVNIHINIKCEYCSTKENNFLYHSVYSDTGRKICELFNLVLLPPPFFKDFKLMSA